jgi:tRNA-specific 2-thiouridylase
MRIAVGISGGVDSSVAAHMLRSAGHDVFGITAWLWNCTSAEPSRKSCCGSLDALRVARDAALALGIEHEVVNLADHFDRLVVSHAVESYARGVTPNPCVVCNAQVRFPFLAKTAREMGAEALATGHYARLNKTRPGVTRLLRGMDPEHDQSYFLFALEEEDRRFAVFPLGALTKAEVRKRASEMGHPSAARPSSQDLCFAAGKKIGLLAEERAAGCAEPGPVVHVDGDVIGRHEGLTRYTVGQRKRIGIAWREPLYVLELRPEANELVVGPHHALYRSTFDVLAPQWLHGDPFHAGDTLEAMVQVRYHTPAVACVVRRVDAGAARVQTATPIAAVAPGQAAVFYNAGDAGEVVGGGWIARTHAQTDSARAAMALTELGKGSRS